ncbi:MAG: hypothetical protein QF405_10305 [Roseibacillus sp.]|nr:hypothetical protein [Roseibacillus sp.]
MSALSLVLDGIEQVVDHVRVAAVAPLWTARNSLFGIVRDGGRGGGVGGDASQGSNKRPATRFPWGVHFMVAR